ncbi:MAG TPA: GerMN domain-containing protein [Acidimicrobiales bacterium]|nr:GerMN domain-containing protein [Acidimicrobiales bacterium]
MKARAGALGLVLTIIVGCGIPVDERARPLSRDEVPSPLRTEAPPPTTQFAAPSPASAELFFVRDSRLAPVGRQTETPSVDDALAALGSGPTASERGDGLRTALPGPVELAGADAAGVPVVEVAESFGEVEGEEQILALAQIVFTLTGLPGVNGVAFSLSGRVVEVPTGDGTLKAGPLGREDYAVVAPLGSAARGAPAS